MSTASNKKGQKYFMPYVNDRKTVTLVVKANCKYKNQTHPQYIKYIMQITSHSNPALSII